MVHAESDIYVYQLKFKKVRDGESLIKFFNVVEKTMERIKAELEELPDDVTCEISDIPVWTV